ncbi:acyl-homoserine-lactone synthase [Sphingomonas soli]|uniref:acyl-homoserine-lactone synthase n=1 Tax=Sphingomonas soli TaxID=266127 RepID=UPI00082D7BA1|nr:acyl-homoserine-lactone synthase [Sphingomonas soli]
MFLTIGSGAGGTGDAILRAMFEARKRVFVDLLGWDVPVLADRYEIDQFDDPHATYLVLSDAAGNHLGSARLLETTRPHILDTLFPELCEGAIPRSAAIREITRFCLDPRQNARQRRRTRDTLVHALAAHALETGLTGYTGVAETGWLQQILAFGWDCEPLGLPHRSGQTMLGALSIAVTPDTPALLRRAGIVPDAVLSAADARHAA